MSATRARIVVYRRDYRDRVRDVRHAREDLGYRNVVLCAWSGGGPLATLYQSQAETPTITHTPASDRYNLTRAEMMPVDALMFIAAHTGRDRVLAEWIDPSVRDELHPDDCDPALSLYGGRVLPPLFDRFGRHLPGGAGRAGAADHRFHAQYSPHAQEAVPVNHTHCVFDAATMADKIFHRIDGAAITTRTSPTISGPRSRPWKPE